VCLIHNILSEKADNNESFHYFAKRWKEDELEKRRRWNMT
jgi:hypothetical protein